MSFTSQALGLLNTAAKAVGGAKIISAAAKDAEVKKAEAILGTEKERIDINAQEKLAGKELSSANEKVKEAKANLGNKERNLEAAKLERDNYNGAVGEIYDELDANVSRSQKAVETAKKNLANEKALRKEQRIAFNARMQELEARKNAYNARATALGMKENLYKGGKK